LIDVMVNLVAKDDTFLASISRWQLKHLH